MTSTTAHRIAGRRLPGRGNHAATDVFWLSTVAIFRQPSILRNLICPLATRLKSRTSAASSLGSEPCVFTRRLLLGETIAPPHVGAAALVIFGIVVLARA